MNNSTVRIAVALRCAAFAFAVGVAFGSRPLTAFAADPSLSSIEVQTPCGTTIQIPGTGEPGKEGCSGNLLVPLSVGPLTLYYNSQYESYNSTDNPRSLPPSYGFGRGITAFPELVKDGNDFKLRLGDGTIQRYTYATEGKWVSAAQPLGNSSVIMYANSKYELQLLPRSEKIIFQAVGFQYVPMQHITEGGATTVYRYGSAASSAPLIPSSITNLSTGNGIALRLSTDGNVVTTIIDDRGRSYGLSYSGRGDQRLLTGITWPDGSSYTLTYDTDGRAYLTAVKDPFGRYTFYSFFKHGRLKAAGTSTSSQSYEYSANSITTQSLSSTAAPLQFERVSFDDYGCASEFRSGDGAPSESQTGILLTKVTHDPIGRITSSTDQLGNTTYLYYNADGSCSRSASDPGTSPLPTCTVSNGVQVTTTRDAQNLPTTITRRDPSGAQVTTALTWGEGAHIKEKRILDSQGRTTFSETVDYQEQLPNKAPGQFPTRVAVKTSQFFDAYDELGRVLRMTDSSGIESSYVYDQAGQLNTITFGGIATSISQNLSGDGAGTWSVSGPGGQQTFTSNFLGTQSSSTLAPPPGSRAQFTFSTTSAMQPGIGRTHATATDRLTGAGGKVTYQSEATSTLGSDGGTSSSSESRLNIQ